MTTASKRPPPARGKQPARPRTKPPAPPDRPFLRFYHSEALRKKTLALLGNIEKARDATAHRDELSALVVELTDSGLDYYFMKPLKLAVPGVLVEQTARLGLAGVRQVVGTVARQVIGRMNGPQLISLCGSIRQLML